MRISDWSSDVCSSDLNPGIEDRGRRMAVDRHREADLVALGQVERHPARFGVGREDAHRRHRPERRLGRAQKREQHQRGGETTHRPVATMERRSEEQTSGLQSIMRLSYAVFCLKTKKN